MLAVDVRRFADSQQAVDLAGRIRVKLVIGRAFNHHAHLVVILLAEEVEIQTGEDAEALVQVAFRMEILAEAGADVRDPGEPLFLRRFELFLAVDDLDIHVGPVAVGEEFLDAGVELQIRADEDDPFCGGFDDFFDEVVDAAVVRNFAMELLRSTLQTSKRKLEVDRERAFEGEKVSPASGCR